MINLLLLYDQMNTTTEVNLSGTVSVYGDGNHSFRIKSSSLVTSEDLNWCDACFANRPSSVYMVRISHAIRESGRIFMSLFDDDLLNLPKGNSGRWKKKYVLKCLEGSDIVISPNPLIIDNYKEIALKSKFVLVNTHIDKKDIKPITQIGDKIRIVYAAGLDHTVLFDKYIKPSLDKLADRFSSKIELTLIGIRPDLSEVKQKEWIRQIDVMPYEQYKQFMMSHVFDIGLAPLEDNPFSNRKYFNKFFEYSKNGIVGLYSNCLPYTLVIKHGKNGVLVENTEDAWYDALSNAIEQIEDLKIMAVDAQDQLRTVFSTSAIRKIIKTEIDDYVIEHGVRRQVDYSHSHVLECHYEVLKRWHQFTAHVYKDGLFNTIEKVLNR